MKKSISMVFSFFCAAGTMSLAQNSVPYAETFEGYNAGSNLLLNSVWQGDTNTAIAVVTNVTYSRTAGNPIDASSYTNVMAFSTGPLTNEFSGSGYSVVALDTMIQPVFAEPPSGAQLSAASNSQVALYFATNGYATIFHGVLSGTAPENPPSSRQWTALTNTTPLETGAWVRLTVVLRYDTSLETGVISMYKVAINTNFISSENGYSEPYVTNSPTGGPWFVSPKWEDAECYMHRVVLSGSGMLDDMVVTTNEITIIPPEGPAYATNGVEITWMQDSGLTTNETLTTWDQVALDDEDGDGAPNWAEYYAGTHPTNPASKLIIVSLTYSNGFPVLKWIGTTNARAPYSIEWSSNLMSVLNWDGATNDLPRSEGTNEVPLPAPVSNPGFLRVIVNTNAP
jgi:hypothetical protein